MNIQGALLELHFLTTHHFSVCEVIMEPLDNMTSQAMGLCQKLMGFTMRYPKRLSYFISRNLGVLIAMFSEGNHLFCIYCCFKMIKWGVIINRLLPPENLVFHNLSMVFDGAQMGSNIPKIWWILIGYIPSSVQTFKHF